LAAVGLYLALVGQTSCGCFGRIAVNPWLMFAVDVAVMGALVLSRPAASLQAIGPSWSRGPLKLVLGSAGFLVAFFGLFLVAFDNPLKALARLRGEPITVIPSVSEVGQGIPGEIRSISVQVINYTEGPI